MVLPVVVRELRVRARRKSTAYVRVAVAAFAMFVAGCVALMQSLTALRFAGGVGGSAFFHTLNGLLFLFCLFEGARLSIGFIHEERRNHTLGLLYLTPLTPMDVLLGKLVGVALPAFLTLMAAMPALSLGLLMGGLTGGEFFRGSVALVNALGLSIAAGAWASARSRDPLRSILLALGAIGVICLGTVVAEIIWQLVMARIFPEPGLLPIYSARARGPGLFSPALAMAMAADGVYPGSWFWLAQALQPVLAAVILLFAGRALHQSWRRDAEESGALLNAAENPALPRDSGHSAEGMAGRQAARRIRARRWLAAVVVLAALAQTPQFGPLFAGGAAMTVWMILAAPLKLLGAVAGLMVAYVAARMLGDAKETGELEVLLTTPAGDRELVAALWAEMRRFPWAMTWVEVVGGAVGILGVAHTVMNAPGGVGGNIWALAGHQFAQYALSVGLAWWSAAAWIWVAFWFSVRLRGVALAVIAAYGGIVATSVAVAFMTMLPAIWIMSSGVQFPVLTHMVSAAPNLVALMVFLAWVAWAKRQLRRHFRAAVAGVPTPVLGLGRVGPPAVPAPAPAVS